MKLNAWIEALLPADKAILAEQLNKDPVAALRAYKAYAGIQALKVLSDIFRQYPLENLNYEIRTDEGEGWDGPRVKEWAETVKRAEALILEK